MIGYSAFDICLSVDLISSWWMPLLSSGWWLGATWEWGAFFYCRSAFLFHFDALFLPSVRRVAPDGVCVLYLGAALFSAMQLLIILFEPSHSLWLFGVWFAWGSGEGIQWAQRASQVGILFDHDGVPSASRRSRFKPKLDDMIYRRFYL